jgi:hypothetical protein
LVVAVAEEDTEAEAEEEAVTTVAEEAVVDMGVQEGVG